MDREHKANLRSLVRGAYDLQELRIQMGNRIVANFKAKLGQAPSEREDTLDAEGKKLLTDLRERYRKLTDGMASFPRARMFKGDELISNYTELCLMAEYTDLEDNEAKHFRRLKHVLADLPIYTEYLEKVKGIGPAMAGVIVSEMDPHKASTPSGFWKYAGLDVVNGEGRSRKERHLEEIEYTNKDGEVATRKGITFNPFLKTKLVGVLGPSFLRAGENRYSLEYYLERRRLERHDVYGLANDERRIDERRLASAEKKGRPEKYSPKLHRHNMAMRKMIKIFLLECWENWRVLEGLPIQRERDYNEALLGHVHNFEDWQLEHTPRDKAA